MAGVPLADHEKPVLEVKGLQETLGKTKCMLDAMKSHLQAMERAQTRREAQLDLLIHLQQSGAQPSSSAQAPPSSHGKDPGMTYVSLRRTLGVRNLRGKFSVYASPFLAVTVNGPMKRGRNFVLETTDTTFVGRFLALSNTWSPTL